ncbi:hypothetical protein ACFL35_11015 [Candidatus Riflebacteria bacterium]
MIFHLGFNEWFAREDVVIILNEKAITKNGKVDEPLLFSDTGKKSRILKKDGTWIRSSLSSSTISQRFRTTYTNQMLQEK